MKAPILMLVAGADFTPVEELEKFSQELTAAGVPNRMRVYEGAPHSFFDRTFDQYRDACADAWRQMFAFIEAPPTLG
jgi:carboxymethylenebutenolidase